MNFQKPVTKKKAVLFAMLMSYLSHNHGYLLRLVDNRGHKVTPIIQKSRFYYYY